MFDIALSRVVYANDMILFLFMPMCSCNLRHDTLIFKAGEAGPQHKHSTHKSHNQHKVSPPSYPAQQPHRTHSSPYPSAPSRTDPASHRSALGSAAWRTAGIRGGCPTRSCRARGYGAWRRLCITRRGRMVCRIRGQAILGCGCGMGCRNI